ncbi:LOW QUALITY PROTEIN: uncharacterized protein LOC110226559 [Arabidopsis lyrata subsp. lyrata]|uniref:LOW QUALITY PROTEIN: uncharacterized protein LOC110226559 n=1 Tax=Arabidopsis lyrata subsp. lyrata TaxID=81972 RepID=UPI000A29ADBC|nr:LOW QUALITY PROTEIN: uncharacterized protein LOC110226559 [Arabidopsis lyrata subsp. lyrata]|eukprot:XP_020874161.1 LOW QUALITY PROTEIN: uncharacterized protein LOC110226559 [Arabidopsis lyrata subsp. lyrata]
MGIFLRSKSRGELMLFLIDLSMVCVRGEVGDVLGGIVSHSFSSTHDRSWLRTIAGLEFVYIISLISLEFFCIYA